MLKLNGIYPSLPTLFNNDEELALNKIKEDIEKLSRFDLAEFLILGSNGELVHLSEKEKFMVYRLTREAIPKEKLMIAGTGG